MIFARSLGCPETKFNEMLEAGELEGKDRRTVKEGNLEVNIICSLTLNSPEKWRTRSPSKGKERLGRVGKGVDFLGPRNQGGIFSCPLGESRH